MIALRFFGGCPFQLTAGDTVNVSQPSVSLIIRRVSVAIVSRLDQFIYYPTAHAELNQIRTQFFVCSPYDILPQLTHKFFQDVAGFPGVVGIVDGTMVKIKGPSENEWEYVGRKPGHAINVQGVALPNGCFSNVVAKYPASAHDSRIFRESSLYADLVAGRKEGIFWATRPMRWHLF